MSWKQGVFFLYMICSAPTIRCMVLENLNEPGNNFQMPVQVLDENFDEFARPQPNPINQHFLQNLLQPWPQGNIPVLYIQDEPSDFSTSLNDPAENDYSPSDILFSAMKRSGYDRNLRQGKTQLRKHDSFSLVCKPTREEIFRLLVAITELQDSNKGRIVNICNKKRPIKLVAKNNRFTAK